MDNNLNEDEMALQYFFGPFLVSQLLLRVQAGIPYFKKNSLFYGTTY